MKRHGKWNYTLATLAGLFGGDDNVVKNESGRWYQIFGNGEADEDGHIADEDELLLAYEVASGRLVVNNLDQGCSHTPFKYLLNREYVNITKSVINDDQLSDHEKAVGIVNELRALIEGEKKHKDEEQSLLDD